MSAWTDSENDELVIKYFEMLAKVESGESVNKAATYKQLATVIPRTVKSIEFKFQNVSAVLYEMRLPYVDGLKPKLNYQRSLKDAVERYLAKQKSDDQPEPIVILTEKLRRLYALGPVKSTEKKQNAGAVGLTLERCLAIPMNSSKQPDFMGIELKAKAFKRPPDSRRRDNKLQTLFSLVPSQFVSVENKRDLLTRYGYHDDKKQRQALYTSISMEGDSLGFRIRVHHDQIQLLSGNNILLAFELDKLQESLSLKHAETAFVSALESKNENKRLFHYDELLYCKDSSIEKFCRLIDLGLIHLDLTLSEKGGVIKDHGFLWRIASDELTNLYDESWYLNFAS